MLFLLLRLLSVLSERLSCERHGEWGKVRNEDRGKEKIGERKGKEEEREDKITEDERGKIEKRKD